jgi:hypothetical protein
MKAKTMIDGVKSRVTELYVFTHRGVGVSIRGNDGTYFVHYVGNDGLAMGSGPCSSLEEAIAKAKYCVERDEKLGGIPAYDSSSTKDEKKQTVEQIIADINSAYQRDVAHDRLFLVLQTISMWTTSLRRLVTGHRPARKES